MNDMSMSLFSFRNSETVEDISVSLTLHCNLQFSVAASSLRICDVFRLICAFNFRLIIIIIIIIIGGQ